MKGLIKNLARSVEVNDCFSFFGEFFNTIFIILKKSVEITIQ